MPPAFPPLPCYKSLTPAEQKLCLRVRHFLTRQLALDLRGQTVLLAVSGGADSLALLCVALLLRPVLGHRVVMAHVDHGLRPESGDDARYVHALATAWDIPCHCVAADVRGHAVREGTGVEEAARTLRYRLLEEARTACGARWLCMGHHAADLREDMLMRLLRGTGWPALGGMDALDVQRHLVRPLIQEEPEALRSLLHQQALAWREDRSNADTVFTRNRVRHLIMPALQKENPAFGHAVRQLWRMAQDDADYWETRLAEACTAHGVSLGQGDVVLPAALLRTLHRAERLRLYLRVLRHLARQGGHGQARSDTLYRLDDALAQGRGGRVFQLSGGISAHLRCGNITFRVG